MTCHLPLAMSSPPPPAKKTNYSTSEVKLRTSLKIFKFICMLQQQKLTRIFNYFNSNTDQSGDNRIALRTIDITKIRLPPPQDSDKHSGFLPVHFLAV